MEKRDVLSAISESVGTFSKGQRRIASYILNNYDKAAFMTASKLGETVGVSESTVVRFAADLGYDGYPEMRKALQEIIKNCLTSVQRIEVSKDLIDDSNLPASVLSADIDKIRYTLEGLDQAAFDAAVDAIVNARNIYIIGMRSSAALASFLGFYLNLLFPNVRVVSDNSANEIFEQIIRVSSGDTFIAISFPRYSRRTIRAMRYARDMGATVIGITDTETSLVAPLSLIIALLLASANHSKDDLVSKFGMLEDIWAEYQVYEKN